MILLPTLRRDEMRKRKPAPYDARIMQIGNTWGMSYEEMRLAWTRYEHHKARCIQYTLEKGISKEMRLTFEEWCEIWFSSGKYHLRGRKRGQYVMARNNDVGHYEIGNVSIQSGAKNRADAIMLNPELHFERSRRGGKSKVKKE